MIAVRRCLDFLRRVLFADAAISAASGLVMLAGASLGGRLLGLPPALLMAAAASLLPNAFGLAFLIAQAAAPAVLAELQWIGLRRVPARPIAA